MELRHLRYFVAVAEEGSFTRASERLWVTQPGLSAQIRRLERELGTQLFHRHARGITLTPVGTVFLDRARSTLVAAEAAEATGRDLDTGSTGTLRVGLASGPRWSRTHVLLERFAREFAGVELTVFESHAGALWRDLRDGRIDALMAPSWARSGDLRHFRLGVEPWTAVMSESHCLADGDRPLDVGELSGHRIAVATHRDAMGLDRAVAEMLEELGVTAVLEPAPPEPAVLSLIGLGRVLTLTTAPTSALAGVSARPLQPRRRIAFDMLWRNETPSAPLERLIEVAVRVIDLGRGPRLAIAA